MTASAEEYSFGYTERFFEHDGNPHSLTATATGLVNSDTCNVTVTGEQTDIGTYTATATGISNSNYKLPTTGLTASFTIYPSLSDLWNAIGDEVWTGYGEQTGVISYSRGDEPNEFRASFMGGKYTFDVPFGNMRFNPNSAVNNFDQDIYAFDIDLPAVTGMSSETLGVKFQDGKISGISSQNAGIAKMGKENDVSACRCHYTSKFSACNLIVWIKFTVRITRYDLSVAHFTYVGKRPV